MDATPLTTELRTDRGKGAARQLRMNDKMPGVLYGPGLEPIALTVAPKELAHALSGPYRRNQLLSLKVQDKEHLALIRELQVHPVTRAPLHADFYRVDPEQSVEVLVPLKVSGRAKGVVAGGELRVLYRDLPVRAKPANIPSEIAIDVTNLELNETIDVSSLAPGEGAEVAMPGTRHVVVCQMPRRRPEEEEGAGGPPGAPGAAPAAGGEAAAAEPEKKD